jgi:hypothetical protein
VTPPRQNGSPLRAPPLCAACVAVALCLLLPIPRADAVEASGAAHVELGAAVDSNAGRELQPLARGDGLALGLLGLEGTVAGDGALSASGRYALGVKRFLVLHGDDLAAQELSAEARAQLPAATLSLLGRLKDRRTRGGERDYTSAGASLGAGRRIGRFALQLDAGAERFVYRSDAAYSYAGPRAALEGSWLLAAHHRLVVDLELARHVFDAESAFASADRREDVVTSAGLSYRFKGPILASAGYGFLQSSSNQPGRSLQRHRLEGSVGLFLPLDIALAATAAVQRTRFPEGLTLSPELLLTTDDENTNSATISLSRRFDHGLQVELRGAGYLADFSGNDLHYRRVVGQLTVGWDGPP